MKRTVLISYEHFTAKGHLAAGFWSGIFEDTGEGFDYTSKKQLIESAEQDGYAWKVIRGHRNGTKSVIQQSK